MITSVFNKGCGKHLEIETNIVFQPSHPMDLGL